MNGCEIAGDGSDRRISINEQQDEVYLSLDKACVSNNKDAGKVTTQG